MPFSVSLRLTTGADGVKQDECGEIKTELEALDRETGTFFQCENSNHNNNDTTTTNDDNRIKAAPHHIAVNNPQNTPSAFALNAFLLSRRGSCCSRFSTSSSSSSCSRAWAVTASYSAWVGCWCLQWSQGTEVGSSTRLMYRAPQDTTPPGPIFKARSLRGKKGVNRSRKETAHLERSTGM